MKADLSSTFIPSLPEAVAAVENVKTLLADCSTPTYQEPKATQTLSTNASKVAVRAHFRSRAFGDLRGGETFPISSGRSSIHDPTRPVLTSLFATTLSVSLSNRSMMALSRSFKDLKRLTILQNGKERVLSMDCVKPAYLDKLVTENAPPVFHPNPPVMEIEESIPITCS
ncbi:unnamed protein product [Hymenolepis diminuta]|uniref:Uncharacterized protein n=1 Tax=Hymenolepis diminuta TaxID=6216 RepID=A0A564Y5W7_HYMDI|nr:unnamed protein product [Hymenolepis diminuta]VUZ44475.1 unnamed protein product [Hymenolepis diminuta]VUZ44478.1 unnamed protein product [Hymenolepis diminuta]